MVISHSPPFRTFPNTGKPQTSSASRASALMSLRFMTLSFPMPQSLKRQQDENFALPAREWLECLAHHRSGAVNLHALKVDRNRFHRKPRLPRGHEQITDGN